ncbi:hypothetical protein CBW65_18775 [Tumebacillus avium]|uniref:Uncharacterized protein n=1 Tax=Tumebacillus avium TaxID=1903704 RepID=A0A1Y0ISK2_9BACL|nr:endospore germination permease [Tumebacillus avium]ARU62786.1 hypothetical protein CBW65_18775 [Tumebacillus avium]
MERVSDRQLMLMTGNYITEATLISLPAQIIGIAQQDSWLAYLLPTLVMVFILYLLARTLNRFPQQDLFEAVVNRWSWAGRGITVLYILFFFFILTRDMRMMLDFVNNALLLNTPLLVIGILTVITLVMIARGGVELLGRMTELFFPLFFLVVMAIPITLFKELDYKYLQPFFDQGLVKLLQGSWLALPYFAESFVVVFLCAGTRLPFKRVVYGLFIGFGMLEVLMVTNTLTLGTHLSARMMYPNHEMIRQIRLTDFLDRFDLLIVAVYLPCLLIKLSVSLFVVCHGIKRTATTVSAKNLTMSVGALALVCSLFFYENAIQILNLNYTWPFLGIIFQVLLPVLFFLFLKPKKRREPDEEQKEEAA